MSALGNFLTGLLLVTALLCCPRAFAVLGETERSVEADRGALRGLRHDSKVRGALVAHEIASEALTVREYASPGGRVFAITWHGATAPDLRPFFGDYFRDFESALARSADEPRRGRGPYKMIQGTRVIVERWGHLRSLHGRAYLPELIPDGVSLDEIR